MADQQGDLQLNAQLQQIDKELAAYARLQQLPDVTINDIGELERMVVGPIRPMNPKLLVPIFRTVQVRPTRRRRHPQHPGR